MPNDPRDAEAVRLPPHSLEAEQFVLGALLLSNDALEEVADVLTPADFYSEAHRTAYDAIRELVLAGTSADVLTVAEALQSRGKLDSVGGWGYLSTLVQNVPGASNAGRYAEIVRDRSIRRELLRLSAEIGEAAYARDGRDAAEVLDQVLRRAQGIAESAIADEVLSLAELTADAVAAVEKRGESDAIPGLSTGLADLDSELLGLHGGELVIVAGRPGMGKTTAAMGFALHSAIEVKRPGYVCSLEMRPRALAERSLASVGHVNSHAMRAGRMAPEDWTRVGKAIGKIQAGAPLLIDGSPRMTIERIRARVKRAHRKLGGLSIVVIDYLQLIESTVRGDTRNDALSEITRGLKLLANELEVPVVALSQLSRKCEDRPNKRPMLSDLRDSGALEQDADVVLFVYRDEIYHPNLPDNKGKAELIIAKHREGKTGTVYTTFLPQHNRFVDTEWRPRDTAAPRKPRADLDDDE